MKRIVLVWLTGLFFLGALRAPIDAQTTEEILKQMIQAQGGRSAIEKIKDMTTTGTIEVPQQGLSVPFTQYKKEPDKRRIEMKVNGTVQVQGFDGVKAWELDPQTGKTIEIPGEDAIDIKRGSLALDWMLDPEKYGISLVFKGREKIEAKNFLVLEQVFADGGSVTLFVDPNTYLTFMIRSTILDEMMVEVETETILSDYKNVKGYIMAHRMVSYLRGKEYMRVIYEKVKLNSGLRDQLFLMQR